jgi:hypothetical protein
MAGKIVYFELPSKDTARAKACSSDESVTR